MGKPRPGSRKGMTKLYKSAKRTARKKAAQQRSIRPRSSKVVHETVRSTWDSRLTPGNNLKKIGLQASVNHMAKTRGGRKVSIPIQAIPKDAEAVIEDLEKEASRKERRNLVVHPGERRALEAMIKRHGDNWTAMCRDIKLNYLQWTATQLQRKVERMRAIDATNGMQ
ncbi:Nucleolar protein 16 [Gracilariopsis chorda]|uniref:Nucleolar protein 16 n=1 Tax=Gracilariopsis chorda TaxID=448386 RepID=A0A2V3IY46_9FLOR|nr:Nucleolar protein 16 [Gracilariopsis chorda]|eukprot:PXF47072.1 Nucleolar protein 16 [Gracilariopsis chorda]